MGTSLESIREEWAKEWACSAEELELEVIDKPGIFNKSWKAKVTLTDQITVDYIDEETKVEWDGTKYSIFPGILAESIVPFPSAGKLLYREQEMNEEFIVQKGESLEFFPESRLAGLTWNIVVEQDGSRAVAMVKHEQPGRYVLSEEIPKMPRILLEKYISWETIDSGEALTEEDLNKDLSERGIVYGIKENLWVEFLTVEGEKEVIVAEYTPPIISIQPELFDFVGVPLFEKDGEDNAEKIDYFACKLRLCEKDELLARKKPGKEGVPGVNIFGTTLPVENIKDFSFSLKKNVYLSEDGMEVKASCAGSPVRVNDITYMVENAYIINTDIDLSTGSIDFPGDVKVGKNVSDGLHVHSGGAILIQGSVSSAEVKAETGLVVKNNIIASKIIVGEKQVFRSQFYNCLLDINEELCICMAQVEQLQSVSGNVAVGQLLKVILEKNFPLLPKKAEELEKLICFKDPDCITEEVTVAIRTIKHFLVGFGPLQLKDLLLLKNAQKIVEYSLETKGALVSNEVVCEINYVQNSEINCAGDILCHKGAYNSILKAEGSITIHGVYRGGEVFCNGNIYIRELGGSTISPTVIHASKESRLTIEFCHANVLFYIGKELVRIEEPVQKLDIYREKGYVRVEKIKWDN